MTAQKNQEYAIKYRVIKLENNKYILFPIKLEKGKQENNQFITEKEQIPCIADKNNLKEKYVVDMIFSEEELALIYDYEEDSNFLEEYFFEDYKDTMIYIETSQADSMSKTDINLRTITEDVPGVSYIMDNTIPSVILNEKAIEEMLKSDDVKEIKLILTKYKRLIQQFQKYNKTKGITKINVIDGKLDSIETKNKVDRAAEKEYSVFSPIINNPSLESSPGDISYQGLKKYLEERIFGHQEAIETFAQKLYMNYTAQKGETIDSILLVGPTGVGKTETVKAACSYLGLPYFETNASNIVPQGIKGMSIEDVITGLYEKANGNLEKAQRGLIFLDEFDKLNDSDLEIKSSVKNILLTFTAGGIFPIDNDSYSFVFDSSMTNKIYAGVFERIHEQEKQMGFNKNKKEELILGTGEEIRKKIIQKKYFTQEELTRISTILGLSELDRETKKQILLSSKLSELQKKKNRYLRQFGIELEIEDAYIDAILDTIDSSETGMRNVNNIIQQTMNNAEKKLLEEANKCKKLILTRETVDDPNKFILK